MKPGLQPVLLMGVDGEAPSPSSAFLGAEILFALIPHSLLCLFVQIKCSVNNPGSYLFMAVLFVMNWAGAPQRGEAVQIPSSGPLMAPILFSVGLQCWGKPGNRLAVLGEHFHGCWSARSHLTAQWKRILQQLCHFQQLSCESKAV